MTIFNNTPYTLSEMKGVFASFHFENASDKENAVALAEKALDFKLTVIPATLYMDYFRTGNRSRYETEVFARRDALQSLLLGYLATGDERYTDKLIDLIWATLDEATWVIPAHNVALPYVHAGEPLPDAFGDDVPEIDLFSAEVASLLAWIYHFEKDRLDAVTPVIAKRMEHEIFRRILNPFRRHEMRWMTNFINNWTPWIVSNVLTVAAIFIKEPRELRQIISTAMGYLDRFVMTYGEDGGCNEGPSYWAASVATLFDCIGILHDITGGSLDFYSHPLLKKMCEYFPDLTIEPSENLVANFADCGRRVSVDPRLLSLMGEKTGSEKLMAFAKAIPRPKKGAIVRNCLYRQFLLYTLPEIEQAPLEKTDSTAFYPNLQIAVLRRGNFYLAVKGGHNRESHNHNDLGSFILYRGTVPVLIDAGVGVYSRDTFSENRYKLWTMQSSYHNTPEIDGMMQLPGREHHTDSFALEENTVKISYRSAYPKECSATAITREITASTDEITISDRVTDASSVIYNFMTADKPESCEGGFTVGGCKILFDGDFTVDEIDISYDANLSRSWERPSLFRVRIKTNGALETVIREV